MAKNMISNNSTQENYNTHNRTICWNKRPCYREQTCAYCMNRKIRLISEQAKMLVDDNNLVCFVTVSLPYEFDPTVALLKISDVRKSFHKTIKDMGPYISVMALGEVENKFIPHIHSLCGKITKDYLEPEIIKKTKITNFNLKVDLHEGDIVTQANGKIGYMLKQNLRPTLYYKLKYQRLLTSSRGICTSRYSKLATATTM